MDHLPTTQDVYLGRSITFQLLRRFGWGQMLNLGWFPWRGRLGALNLVASRGILTPQQFLFIAQDRLLERSIEMLAPDGDDVILDVGCGRGRSSFQIAARGRRRRVVGVDIDRASLRIASDLHGSPAGSDNRIAEPRFVAGDATSLAFRDAVFDRILALECAFHFEPRERFIRECARLLRSGGRVLVVDFAWRDRRPAPEEDREAWALVRDTWAWRDFWTTEEYVRALEQAGLHVRWEDWSAHVTESISGLFNAVTALASHALGRKLLLRVNPLLRSFENRHWSALQESAAAHALAARQVRYMALLGTRT